MINEDDRLQPGVRDRGSGIGEGRVRFKAFVQAAILLGLALYFANLVFSDSLKNYSTQPVWLVLGASAFLLLLGVASGMRFLRLRAVGPAYIEGPIEDEPVHEHAYERDMEHDHGHEHGHRTF